MDFHMAAYSSFAEQFPLPYYDMQAHFRCRFKRIAIVHDLRHFIRYVYV